MSKKLLVPITNRTNYTKLRNILRLLSKTNLEIVIVSSSSLVYNKDTSGYYDITGDGLLIRYDVDCALMNDTLANMSRTAAVSLIEHATIIERESPDAALVVGDRFDMLPVAIACRNANVPMMHLQGGERSGSVDDTIRDLISVCSTRHYVATDAAKARVEKLTDSEYVFNLGCPAVEMVENVSIGTFLDVAHFKKKYKNSFGIKPNEKYLLVAMHPNTDNDRDADMSVVLSAALTFDLKTVVIYPNIDAYHTKIEGAIRTFGKDIVKVRHMPTDDFVPLMAFASCMIGNSSAGIREAASFGTPVVNVGQRQNMRERNKNTIDSSCVFEDIRDAVNRSISVGRYDKVNIYSKPNCSSNISKDIEKFMESL